MPSDQQEKALEELVPYFERYGWLIGGAWSKQHIDKENHYALRSTFSIRPHNSISLRPESQIQKLLDSFIIEAECKKQINGKRGVFIQS